MKLLIKSRATIEEVAKKPFPERTALISITDYGCDFADLKHKPDYLLQLAFDDVDADIFLDELDTYAPTDEDRIRIENKYHMLSDEQAKQIVDFYNKVADKVDYMVCQCEHGQSRSAAVIAAIAEYRSKNGIKIFADDRYYPNKTIFKKVFKYLAR